MVAPAPAKSPILIRHEPLTSESASLNSTAARCWHPQHLRQSAELLLCDEASNVEKSTPCSLVACPRPTLCCVMPSQAVEVGSSPPLLGNHLCSLLLSSHLLTRTYSFLSFSASPHTHSICSWRKYQPYFLLVHPISSHNVQVAHASRPRPRCCGWYWILPVQRRR